MAVTVITGTKRTGTNSFAPRTADAGTPGTAVALQAMYRSMTLRTVRPSLEPIVVLATTATSFATVDVGAATGTLSYNGYMSEGATVSDPLYLIKQEFAGQTVNVFGTGNTVTANVQAVDDVNTFAARDNSARGTTFVLTDTPTSDWVDGGA